MIKGTGKGVNIYGKAQKDDYRSGSDYVSVRGNGICQ